jgi:RNA polymerase-binding transcription factor DksA
VPDTPDPSPPAHQGPELEVDLAAFLPEGTSLAPADGEPADEQPAPPADDAAAESEADDAPQASVDAEPAEPADDQLAPPDDDDDVAEVEADGAELDQAPARPPVDVEALSRIEVELAAVDAALAALDDGTYGRCAACDEPIAADLLAADPVRRTCDRHLPVDAPATA